ncbi:MAG: NAD(P)/FAD-dependent oxidoreductase, partial [Bacteroidales bacterium]|nr:NAD(P)/FAD-dependent oxidoreductase [Bacteroidales bacterium]
IRPCICCHNACFNMASYKGVGNDQSLSDNMGMARCAINPRTMQSTKYKIVPTRRPRKVAVIGAGIGGLETARVLSLRGHKPVIFEKSDRIGGVFNYAAAPDFKEKDKQLLQWYAKEMADLKVEIKFGTTVKSIGELAGYDKIVVATGARANRPPIKGMEHSIEACDYLGGASVGQKVIIIGGGLSGCEIAYDLYRHGKTPVIVEMKNDLIAVKGVCLANSSYLRDFFELNKVEVHLETRLKEITEKGVIVTDASGKTFEIEGDSVITSMGYKPQPLFEAGCRVKLVGDCDHIGNLRTAIWRAWDVAMKI